MKRPRPRPPRSPIVPVSENFGSEEVAGDEVESTGSVARCFFAHLGGCRYRADGQPDRAHWIPKQRLRLAGIVDVWDERTWTPMCRRHHDAFDNGRIFLAEEQYPDPLREFAEHHGFFFAGRRGWISGSRTDPEAA